MASVLVQDGDSDTQLSPRVTGVTNGSGQGQLSSRMRRREGSTSCNIKMEVTRSPRGNEYPHFPPLRDVQSLCHVVPEGPISELWECVRDPCPARDPWGSPHLVPRVPQLASRSAPPGARLAFWKRKREGGRRQVAGAGGCALVLPGLGGRTVGSPESLVPRLWMGHAETPLAGLLTRLPLAFQTSTDPAWPSSSARLPSLLPAPHGPLGVQPSLLWRPAHGGLCSPPDPVVPRHPGGPVRTAPRQCSVLPSGRDRGWLSGGDMPKEHRPPSQVSASLVHGSRQQTAISMQLHHPGRKVS